MNDTEIIIEVAKLAFGEEPDQHFGGKLHFHGTGQGVTYIDEFQYLTSRDAIVPVIEKNNHIAMSIIHELDKLRDESNQNLDIPSCGLEWWLLCKSTPRQLCIALLKATDKWREQQLTGEKK